MSDKNVCPVCGYLYLKYPPYDEYGCPSSEVCPCCGTEFGYDDANNTHEELRNKWIEKGMQWLMEEQKPMDWDVIIQLKAIGVKFEETNF
ncbi:hypothetical protein H6G93_11155 [Nostoc sp. FACHB-973]|nr:hypothetical protein [Nostoc sp. FACHB-973]